MDRIGSVSQNFGQLDISVSKNRLRATAERALYHEIGLPFFATPLFVYVF